MGEPTQTVTIHAACPNCGRNAIWYGTYHAGGTTSYRIACDCPLPPVEQLGGRR